MTEPTDADRKRAAELIYGNRPRGQVEAVARGLAAARAEATANAYVTAAWRLEDAFDEGTSVAGGVPRWFRHQAATLRGENAP